jgi:hypothetical protein
VVFKSTDNFLYLLDFSLPEAKAFGPYEKWSDLDLRVVLYDPTTWLILDGGQEKALGCSCRMLLACLNKKANYHQFAKHPNCRIRYIPVWIQEEVEEFLEDLKPRRSDYKHMLVADDGTVMENFRLFGGVPRYVFNSARSEYEKPTMRKAIKKLDYETCLNLFSGLTDDNLVHMKCLDDTYSDYQYDFASQCVVERTWEQLQLRAKHDAVHYLEKLLGSPSTGAAFGNIYEVVAHSLVA